MVATAKTKISVNPASRMFSAISFGVFCRSAPSTNAIMRSRNVEPCAAVMRTLIQSDSTRVPPVTAERSPPDSRMTGADSPVMADSSTEAMPSITSPSLGINSPISTMTTSPCLRSGAATISKSAPLIRFAIVSVRALRNVAACALPRPSATASAKLANRTVIHSHRMIWKVKLRYGPCVTKSRRKMIVVRVATTSTTNITGLRTINRGSSLRNESPIAGPRIAGSSIVDDAPRLLVLVSMLAACVEQSARLHREMLDDGAKGEGWKESQTASDQDHADHEANEQSAIGRERASRYRNDLLAHQRSGDRQHRNDHQEAADEHRQAQCGVPERNIGGQSGEGAAVVAGGGDVRIQRLTETVRAGVGHRAGAGRDDHGQRGKAKHGQRQDQDAEHGHLDLLRFQFLAQIFRRAADHQSGDEHGDDHEQQHSIKAGADASEDDFAQHDVDHWDHAGDRQQAVMHVVDGAAGRVSGDRGEQRGVCDAEADFLAFHVATGLQHGWRLIDMQSGEGGIAGGLSPVRRCRPGEKQHGHDAEDSPTLALIADHAAKHVGQSGTEREDQQDLDQVGQRARVFKRM